MIEAAQGLRLPALNLWLDAPTPKAFSFVSHAHGDHVAQHDHVLTTPATARLASRKLDKVSRLSVHDFDEPFSIGDARATLLPSGHMLGAAQLLIETDVRLVYTGDFRLSAGETYPPASVVPCDVLVMECTYGKPAYVFPDRSEVVSRLIRFVDNAIEDRAVPVLFAYQMGKSQEALKILGDRGYTVMLARPIYEVVKLYEGCGVEFQHYALLEGENFYGQVLLLPPYLKTSRILGKISRKRTAMLTGWAVDRDARTRFGVDEVIPISDHADFQELMAYVELARPTKVYTVHGQPDFAAHLRRRGIHAVHLGGGAQLHLWDEA